MNKHVLNYFKIILALVMAFIIALISSSTLFYPASPQLNPQFIANVSQLFQKKNPYDELKNLPLSAMKKISQGVYAKKEPSLNTTFVRITREAKFEIKQGIILQKH